MAVQEAVAQAVEREPEHFLARYVDLPDAFGGRYVGADLFKETFAEYAASREARGRYNNAVHNAAAVLSAEQFRRSISDGGNPVRNTVVFLTGIPGAGKTSSVTVGKQLPSQYRTVFEGQLVRPETSIPKIRQVLDLGLAARIIVVHRRPEDALHNTFKRFELIGRGASIGVMSDIQGGLADGLSAIKQEFGERVSLWVSDMRDSHDVQTYKGWGYLDLLRSEGNREVIHERLSKELDKRFSDGSISEDCYRQARGLAPIGRGIGMAGPDSGRHEADGVGRGLPPRDRQTSVIAPSAVAQLPFAMARAKASGAMDDAKAWLDGEHARIGSQAGAVRALLDRAADRSLPRQERHMALAAAETGARNVELAWAALIDRDGPEQARALDAKTAGCGDFAAERRAEFADMLRHVPEPILTLPYDFKRRHEALAPEVYGIGRRDQDDEQDSGPKSGPAPGG